jgi:hypothetical protein
VGGGLAFRDFEDFARDLVARAEFHDWYSCCDGLLSSLKGACGPD